MDNQNKQNYPQFIDIKLSDKWRTCRRDSDCIETQMDCCFYNSEGIQTAIKLAEKFYN